MADLQKRGRGRLPGESNPRPDRELMANVPPGDNRHYLEHSLQMWDWPAPNYKDAQSVLDRVKLYLQLCAEDDWKPSVAGLAFALGMSRKNLWRLVSGEPDRDFSPQALDVLKKAYRFLNVQMEDYMQNGKINPVSGIFLMKNNMEYSDKTEIVAVSNQNLGEKGNPDELRKKYIDDIVTVDDDND